MMQFYIERHNSTDQVCDIKQQITKQKPKKT